MSEIGSMIEDLNKGDEVRVTFVGKVKHVTGKEVVISTVAEWYSVSMREDEIESLEVIKSFKSEPWGDFLVGDRIKRKNFPEFEVTLSDEGYIQHFRNGNGSSYYVYNGKSTFTNDKYDLVYRATI